MIPVLYDKAETNFSTMGLGALSDAIKCEVRQVLNGEFELVMQYPQDGIRFNDLANENIIKAVAERKKNPQLFSIYSITKPINGIVTINAQHISGRKEFIPVMPCSADDVQEAFTEISLAVAETNPFTFWTDKTDEAQFEITVPRSLGQCLGGATGSILELYGGEYEFDNNTIKLWANRGHDIGVTLRYGKNITDFEQEENISSTITGICPFWADSEGNTVFLPEKTVDSEYAPNFAFKRTIVKDFSDHWRDAPSVSDLRAYAQAYVSQNGIGVPKVSIKISFEHLADYAEYKDFALLEEVQLGDTVHVFFEPLGVTASARVVETRYDTLLDKYVSIQVGSVKADMATVVAELQTETETMVTDVQTTLTKAMADAISSISGVSGGNIVIRSSGGKPYEILVIDTDEVATATNVLRMNNAGLAYSSDGVNGNYAVAITGDGIVANSITSGTLDASVIAAGSITASKISISDLSALSATIGGFTIDEDSVYSGDKRPAHLSGCGMSKNGANYAFWSKGDYGEFKVGSNGVLQATGANISGTITATNSSFSGSVTATSGSFTNGTFSNCVISNNCTVDGSIGAGGLTINNGSIKLTTDSHGVTTVVSGYISETAFSYGEHIIIGGKSARFEYYDNDGTPRLDMIIGSTRYKLSVDSNGFVKGTVM